MFLQLYLASFDRWTNILVSASSWLHNSNLGVSLVTKLNFVATNVVKELLVATVSAIMRNSWFFLSSDLVSFRKFLYIYFHEILTYCYMKYCFVEDKLSIQDHLNWYEHLFASLIRSATHQVP